MGTNVSSNWMRSLQETNRDFPSYFHAEKYESIGYKDHLHRNIEVYCVVKGRSHVTINEREYDLTEGQAVVINSMQIHSYKNSEGTIVSFLLIGSNYLQLFNSLYPERILPEFLFDKDANKPVLEMIDRIAVQYDDFDAFESMSYSNLLIHHIVGAYGTEVAKKGSKRFIFSEIIQYIYDHYTEDLSLTSLAEQFGYEMTYFRFPEGAFSEQTLALTKELGYSTLFWSFAYADWDRNAPPSTDMAYEKITSSAHNGAILLLHAVCSSNAEVLGRAIDNIIEQGYTFSTTL